jgi:hypothetical protein
MGMVSGCYPLDPFYTGRPEAIQIRNVRTHITDRTTERDGISRTPEEL